MMMMIIRMMMLPRMSEVNNNTNNTTLNLIKNLMCCECHTLSLLFTLLHIFLDDAVYSNVVPSPQKHGLQGYLLENVK